MKLTKRQIKRIIREEKRLIAEQSEAAQTPWAKAMDLVILHYDHLSSTRSGSSDDIGIILAHESFDVIAEELADWWADSKSFSDYPGDADAMFKALRDPSEIIVSEAIQEFLISR
tara:strand:+ start:46 stop:390 length:345 start_codon:yes stop_codon:yes gene_type:complete